MIQINPLQSYIDGGARAAITTPPSASLVFDLPGKAIWVKGVKLKGTDHAYTFSHDNYISITNTPDQNNPESEDIKIGINTTLLKLAIDTTYGIVNATTNGLAPMFSNANKASATAATTYNFLGIAGSTLKWYQLPWRNVRINAETSDVLGIDNTDPLIISSGNGIEVSWDSTNKKIVITNTKPDINHNTDTHVSQLAASDNADRPVILKQSANTDNEVGSVRYTSTLLYNPSTKILKINGNRVVTFADTYVGATSSADATTGLVPIASSANRNKFLRGDGTWLTPSDYNTWRPVKVGTTDALGSGTDTGALVLAAGTGISLSWDSTNKQVIITNSSPDVNHNTDKTGVKLGTVSGTKKTDGTVIITNSSAGLTFQGGTNLIKIGDGTNYIEVPITISHGLSTKNMTINGTAYALYTSASSLPTIIAPSSFGTANYILATNSSGNGFAWVAKPASNVTTAAVVSNSATGTTQITTAQGNPYYNLLEGGSVTRSIRFVAGTGITISAATDGLITITNSAPDLNHNTDRTGVKLGTVSGTKKTDSTVIINNSTTGLTFQGGTNLFKIGDGTNYVEIPVTPSFTVTDKSANILSTLTTLATIAGTDIKAKVVVDNKAATLTTTSQTIATVAGVDITAKITNYNTDENVKLVDNNNNENVPIVLKNGTGTGTIISSVRTVDGVTINPSANSLSVGGNLNVGGRASFGSSVQSNYITFHGLTSDGGNSYDAGHTYIGNRLYQGTSTTSTEHVNDFAELVLFLGNDSNGGNAFNPNGTGPDRIRHIAGAHLFLVYTSALNGTFEAVCGNANLVSVFAINSNHVVTPFFYKSTIATGTAPIQVTSTTVCTNLNADMIDGIHANGLFTDISRPSGTNNISITIGGTTKTITLGSNAWGSVDHNALRGHRLGYRHLDAGPKSSYSDSRLYIGYNGFDDDDGVTNSIGFYRSTGTGSYTRTLWAEINSNGLYALTRFGVNGQNTGYNFYVNGSSYLNGEATIHGNLNVGASSTSNYIQFFGLTGDNPVQASAHYYIGNRHWADGESSELFIFSGNDIGNGNSASSASGPGPDRFRVAAAAHLFQTYTSALSGTFETVATSSVLKNIFEINTNNIKSYVPFISIVETGTAPILVSSTTLNTNLNADLLDGIHANGLFTIFDNSENNITATIGGTTKTFTVNYATNAGNADTLDDWHRSEIAPSTLSKYSVLSNVSVPSGSYVHIGVGFCDARHIGFVYTEFTVHFQEGIGNGYQKITYKITFPNYNSSEVNNIKIECYDPNYQKNIRINKIYGYDNNSSGSWNRIANYYIEFKGACWITGSSNGTVFEVVSALPNYVLRNTLDLSNISLSGSYFYSSQSIYGLFIGDLNGNASSATNDSDGNAINNTYLKKSGGTMTGSVTCATSGANLKWGNITIYGGGSNGGINSLLVGDDVTIGDCNAGGIMGMKSTGTNAGFKFFNSSGTSIGGVLSTNGTLQWQNASGTFYNIYHSGNLTNLNLLTNGPGYITNRGHRLGYRHLDAGPKSSWSDSRLYIGYNGFSDDDGVTDSIGFYRSTGTGTYTRTLWAEINSNGLYANTRFGVNGQNTSYNFYVNGTGYCSSSLRVNGPLNVYAASGRSNINMVSQTAQPNDLYFGSNGASHWSWTSRESTDPWIGLYRVRDGSWAILILYNSNSITFGYNTYAPHYYESSDIRLKHDISSISQSIRKFRFNDDNKLYYGFIAQELETLHPELVDSSGEYKTVNYNSAICYYIAELENKVQKLEERIRKFESSLT